MKPFLLFSLLLATSVGAIAKLPAPVLDDVAKAKAEETKAKTAHAGKVDGYKLCLSMDRSAVHYYKSAASSGKTVKAATATPPCADPGPFVWPLPAAAAATAGAAPAVAPAAVAPSVPAAPAAAPAKKS